ncbi:MAG: aminotransferase class I/II-fold pyridoxal phosphate-dependent enzyme [Pseudomonadota bacterium]
MSLFADRIGALGTENAFKIGPYIKEVEDTTGKKVIRCNLGEPDFPLPKHIAEEVKRQIDNDLTHYCDPQGILPLREALAKEMGNRRGLKFTPDRVVVFPGGKPPIGFSQEAYCNPGDEVIFPSPGFPIYESFTKYLGLSPVPLHLDEKKGFAFTGEELEPLITKKTKIIIVNFPSNPTGGVASKEQLETIADVIRKKAPQDCRVYSDEIYENILFDGSRHFSIASLPGMEERTIVVSGASKSWSWTGGRIGWAVFPTAEEAKVFKNLNINYFSCTAAYNQMGCKTGIESKETAPAVNKMVTAFQERRDVVVRALNEIKGITCQMPKGAFYVFPNIGGVCEEIGAIDMHRSLPPDIRSLSSPSTLFNLFLLFEYQVATMDRRSFGVIGSDGKHFLRLSIATGMDDLKEGMRRIGTASKDREGFTKFVRSGKRLF